MLRKKDYVYIAVICYIVLVMLFFSLKENRQILTPCAFDSACIKFCCYNSTTCNDKFIKNNFMVPKVFDKNDGQNTTDKYADVKILYGQPECETEISEEKYEWRMVRP